MLFPCRSCPTVVKGLVLLVLLALASHPRVDAQSNEPIQVWVGDVMARPGDRVLVPVVVRGTAGRQIIAGQLEVRYDPAVLRASRAVRQGSLLESQRWLTADQIDVDGDAQVFRFVYAAAAGFAEDGDLVYLAFEVVETAVIGTETTLQVWQATFNNGAPRGLSVQGSCRSSRRC